MLIHYLELSRKKDKSKWVNSKYINRKHIHTHIKEKWGRDVKGYLYMQNSEYDERVKQLEYNKNSNHKITLRECIFSL